MITIENRDDYITITRLLRKSRTDSIRIKIMGRDYLWFKNVFIKLHNESIHDMHFSAYMYINSCDIVARYRPSIKKEQVIDARNFVELTRKLVNIMKGGK